MIEVSPFECFAIHFALDKALLKGKAKEFHILATKNEFQKIEVDIELLEVVTKWLHFEELTRKIRNEIFNENKNPNRTKRQLTELLDNIENYSVKKLKSQLDWIISQM